MSNEPEMKTLDPAKVEETAHQMVTLLYEGFKSMGELLKESKQENETMKAEIKVLRLRIDGLLDKLLSGDDNADKKSDTPAETG